MERGSDKHGPRMDEDLEREAKAATRANPPVRGEAWPDPEAPHAEDAAEGAEPEKGDDRAATPSDLDR